MSVWQVISMAGLWRILEMVAAYQNENHHAKDICDGGHALEVSLQVGPGNMERCTRLFRRQELPLKLLKMAQKSHHDFQIP